MKVSEIILLGGFTVFAGVLLVNSLTMPYFSGQGFGAGFLPLNMSIAVIVLVGVIALRALLNRKGTPAKTDEESTGNERPSGSGNWQRFVAPICTIVLLVAATAVMEFGSVLLPLAVSITIVSALFLRNSWFASIRMTILTLAGIYLIFSVWLGIPIS